MSHLQRIPFAALFVFTSCLTGCDDSHRGLGGACQDDSDCPAGGLCIEIAHWVFEGASECLECYERYCSRACTDSSACPSGWYCRKTEERCYDPQRDCDPPENGCGAGWSLSTGFDVNASDLSWPDTGLFPNIRVDPTAILFFDASADDPLRDEIEIFNDGDAELVVSDISFETDDPEYSFQLPDGGSRRLPATVGSWPSSLRINIQYAPAGEPKGNALVVESNDPDAPLLKVEIIYHPR